MKKISSLDNFTLLDNNFSVLTQKDQCILAAVVVALLAWVYVYIEVKFHVDGPKEPDVLSNNKYSKVKSKSSQNVPSALTLYKLNSKEDINTLYVDEWVEEQYHLIDELLMQNDFEYVNNTDYKMDVRQIIKGTLYKSLPI